MEQEIGELELILDSPNLIDFSISFLWPSPHGIKVESDVYVYNSCTNLHTLTFSFDISNKSQKLKAPSGKANLEGKFMNWYCKKDS